MKTLLLISLLLVILIAAIPAQADNPMYPPPAVPISCSLAAQAAPTADAVPQPHLVFGWVSPGAASGDKIKPMEDIQTFFCVMGLDEQQSIELQHQSIERLAALIRQAKDIASSCTADEDVSKKVSAALNVDYSALEMLIQAVERFVENMQVQG